MSEFDVLSKGRYDRPQSENAVPVDSFMFVRGEGKKYLLLKFNNPRASTLTGMELQITMLTANGRELGEKQVSFNGLFAKPRKDFVPERKIEVQEECSDIRVKVVSAHYGAYSYSVSKNKEQIDYIASPDEKFDAGKALDNLGWESSVVTERTVKNRVLIAVVSLILIAAVLVFTVFQLNSFKRKQETFLYSGVEYAFADNDQSAGTDVYAVAYGGNKANVIIPEEIEGHRVAKISGKAFEGSDRLRGVTIEGNTVIERQAFVNCKNLETVEIPNVSVIGKEAFANCGKLASVSAENLDEIGEGAFKNCSSLTSVNITNARKKLTLGKGVFEKCSGLQTVEIAQTVIYPYDYAVFAECYNVSSLSLENFETKGVRTLISLFGSGVKLGLSLNLQTVQIGSLDSLCDSFLAYSPVKSLTVSSLGSPDIGAYAFYECKSLTGLDLPVSPRTVGQYAFGNTRISSFDWQALTTIGEYAFLGTQLTEFDAAGVIYIGAHAFENSALSSVTLPRSVSKIYEYTFSGCLSLTSFTVTDAVSEIGKGAVNSCSRLENLTVPYIGGSAKTNSYLGYIFGADDYTKSERYIPKSLKNVTVTGGTGVPDFAFYGANSVQKITLPEKNGKIGEYAFAGCTSLEKINLTEPLSSIGAYAFYNCGSITSLTVPDTVVSIGSNAFSGCNKLSSLTAPFIGGSADVNNNIGYLFERIPSSLSVVTLTSAKTLGDSAFKDCTGLKKVILPQDLVAIGEYAFYNCGLIEITLPETLTRLEDYSFAYCRQLQKIIIPASVKYIGRRTTFEGCRTLWEIWNFSGLPVEAMNAIVYDKEDLQLQKFKIEGYEFGYSRIDDSYSLLSYPTNTNNLQLPSGFNYNGETVEGYSIPAYLFGEDNLITSVKIPSCVIRLGEYAFENCSNLERVEFVGAGFTEIEQFTFINCSKLKSITLPDGITKIGENAFDGCASLESLTTASVQSIGNNAFFGCNALKTVKLNSGLNTIGGSAFQYCASLKEIELPEGLTALNSYAFYGCTSLRSVTLPEGLTAIEYDAFGDCGRLRLVYNYSSLKLTKGSSAYGGVASSAIAIVTAADEKDCAGYYTLNGVSYLYCYDEWTAVWSETGVKEIILEEFSFNGKQITSFSVLPYAFANNSELTRVVIGSAVKELGEYVFYNCPSLTSVNFDKSVLTEIPAYAFATCSNLISVIFPSNLTAIGESAFAYCYSYKNVNLPTGLVSIGAYAFLSCGSVSEIIIPAKVSRIGEMAFNNCSSLYVVYNLSALNITERSTSNGWVAYNAVAVFTDLNDKAEFLTVDEFEYVKVYNDWYLFGYYGFGGFIELPQPNLSGNTDAAVVTKNYIIKNYAFEKTSVNYLLVPDCVTKIEDKAFSNYYFTVYYKGTEEGWNGLRPESLARTVCYHYVDCVHADNEWTFIDGSVSTVKDYYLYDWLVTKQPTCAENGIVTGTCSHCKQHTVTNTVSKTDDHDYEWTVTEKPTCAEEGIETGICKICGNKTTRPVPKTDDHDFDNYGVCKICGYKALDYLEDDSETGVKSND